ncbi:class I SAM-dependent methyltransferase [Nocardioides immobilis]|nr:class I SAM-dependent methyltransferase [Nocardioides immobilis]
MRTGDVIKWTPNATGILARPVDGVADPSYTNPLVDDTGLPIPPSWLAQAFTSVPSSDAYLRTGRSSAEALSQFVSNAGASLQTMERIMDFGGGAGRVLRAIHADSDAELVCYDLHQPSIEWCRTHMPFGRWHDGHETPPLNEATGTFDLIYAASVLTHLNEVQQDAWLWEWHRLLRPGGLLIPTFRSEDFVSRVISPDNAEYAARVRAGLRDGGGFTYISNDAWEGVFPGFYSDAYHTSEYVRTHWGEFFEVVDIVLNGSVAGRQDVAVLRKN